MAIAEEYQAINYGKSNVIQHVRIELIGNGEAARAGSFAVVADENSRSWKRLLSNKIFSGKTRMLSGAKTTEVSLTLSPTVQ